MAILTVSLFQWMTHAFSRFSMKKKRSKHLLQLLKSRKNKKITPTGWAKPASVFDVWKKDNLRKTWKSHSCLMWQHMSVKSTYQSRHNNCWHGDISLTKWTGVINQNSTDFNRELNQISYFNTDRQQEKLITANICRFTPRIFPLASSVDFLVKPMPHE